MKKKTIAASIMSIAICGSIVTGATFALFTSESKTNVAIQSGNVDVKAILQKSTSEDWIYSPTEIAADGKSVTNEANAADLDAGVFANGGMAVLDNNDGTLTLTNVTPGDKVSMNIVVSNESTVSVKYATRIAVTEDDGLFAGLDVQVDGTPLTFTRQSAWNTLEVGSEDIVIPVTVELPTTAGNEYEDASAEITFSVKAVQANTETAVVEDDTVYLYTASDLFAFAKSVNVDKQNYIGKTVKLMDDIDLKNAAFTPIGQSGVCTFMGDFDGNGKTIRNLNVEVSGEDRAGLFGWYNAMNDDSVSISNLTLDGVYVKGEEQAGAIVGYMDPNVGSVTINNCHVKNATVIGARTGGIAGFAGTGKAATISNSSVNTVSVAGYKSKAEVVGYSYENYVETNVTVTAVTLKTMVFDDDSLTRALSEAQEGDTIYLGAGEFTMFEKYLNWGYYNINIIGSTNADGTPATVMNFPSTAGAQMVWGIQGTVENIVFKDETNSKRVFFADGNGGAEYHEFTINNCVFDGATMQFTAKATITNCVFDGNGLAWSGIEYSYPTGDVVIDGCTFSGYCFTNLQVTDEGKHKEVTVTVRNCNVGALSENAVSNAEGITVYVDTIVFENNTIDCNVWTPSFASVTKTNNKTSANGEVTYMNW